MRDAKTSLPPQALRCIAILLALLCGPTHAATARVANGDLALLQAEIARLAGSLDGTAGVSIRHLESGQSVQLNADVAFPMASTYKVPIAVKILSMVDSSDLELDRKYTLRDADFLKTHSAISEHLLPGTEVTLENLLSMMLRYSDNVATDVMLRFAGGTDAVTARMRELGLDIRVDRPTWEIILNFVGVETLGEKRPLPPEEYASLMDENLRAFDANDLSIDFYDDPRDSATPAAMDALLTKIWRREILSEKSSARLLDILYGTTTGPRRLRGMLPPGTRVAHKTGTIGATANDVGIIELPHGAGNVVVVVLTKLSRLPQLDSREAVIAQIARAAHDFFVFRFGEP